MPTSVYYLHAYLSLSQLSCIVSEQQGVHWWAILLCQFLYSLTRSSCVCVGWGGGSETHAACGGGGVTFDGGVGGGG